MSLLVCGAIGHSAIAAEQVVLKLGSFRSQVSVAELTDFAETGAVSPTLAIYLQLSGAKPESLRSALTSPVAINAVTLDRALNNPIGHGLLDEIGKTIHPGYPDAKRQALRAALVRSAEQDGNVSLLEIVQNYPTQEVYVEGDRILTAYSQINALAQQIQRLLGWLK
jgi:hypothetical protein